MKDYANEAAEYFMAQEEQLLVDLLDRHGLREYRTPDSLWKAGYVLHYVDLGMGRKRAILAKIVDSESYTFNYQIRADDPVSDLVVKSLKPPKTHTKSAQSDPKRKAST